MVTEYFSDGSVTGMQHKVQLLRITLGFVSVVWWEYNYSVSIVDE